MINPVKPNIFGNSVLNSTINGYKPACLLPFSADSIKIKLDEFTRNNIDFVSPPPFIARSERIQQTYVLNKKRVSEVIKNNCGIFASRFEMPKISSVDDIYERLKAGLKQRENISDLEGITLGFPRNNTMIYYLEKKSELSIKERAFTSYFKGRLMDTIDSNDSPYKDLAPYEITKLKESISNIRNIGYFRNILYFFVLYTNEKSELNRIKTSTKEYIKTFGE